jgi:hypothetical protein
MAGVNIAELMEQAKEPGHDPMIDLFLAEVSISRAIERMQHALIEAGEAVAQLQRARLAVAGAKES